jgi:hypothetical protein
VTWSEWGLAEINADHVQNWLDRVAQDDPAEALRLWLALLRFVTPVLAAAAIADISPPKRTSDQLCKFTDRELLEMIVDSPEAVALLRQGMDAALSVPSPSLPESDQPIEVEDDEELLR